MDAKKFAAIVMLTLFSVLFFFGNAFSQEVTIVQGKVCDAADESPLKDVRIHVEDAEDVSDVLTNKDGKYTIAILDRTEAKLTFSLKGYTPVTKLVKLTEKKVVLDVKLKSTKVLIKMTDFKSQAYIKGKVQGLDAAEYDKYKIVAYVLTDMWYIHPWAVAEEGKGFALIDKGGRWKLETVWRGYQAFKVAFLLVPRDAFVPPTVRLKGDIPETDLLERIRCDHYTIIPAPKGI